MKITKQLIAAVIAGLGLATPVFGAPAPLYENYGLVTTPPQIDATGFLNAGVFDIYTSMPFETQNTLYFTNRGSMTGTIGFRFSYAGPAGRQPASYLENLQTISAMDYSSLYYSVSGLGLGGSLAGSYVIASATNILSPGLLSAGANGIVRLEGKNINLRYGGISATEPVDYYGTSIGLGVTYTGRTNYVNPPDVTDLYWGIGDGNVLGGDQRPIVLGAGYFTPPYPRSPIHEVIDTTGYTNDVVVPSYFYSWLFYGTNYLGTNMYKSFSSFAYTNRPTATSEVIQVVFIATNAFDTNLNVGVRFAPGTGGDPTGRKVIVQFRMSDVDVVTGLPITNYVYFTDDSASLTNSILQDNLATSTYRPSAYTVLRATPFAWLNSFPGNTAYTNTLLLNPTLTNTVVTNAYSAYSTQIGRGAAATNYSQYGYGGIYGYQAGNPALTDPTNYPGRVEFIGIGSDPQSDTLDLTSARIRSEGLLTLKSKNLISTSGAKIDAPMFSVDLGNTNTTLLISNLFPSTVKRLKGQLSAWSGVWTNQRSVVGVTNDPTQTNAVAVTNAYDVKFHVLLLDHTLQTRHNVEVNEFIARGTNVIIADDIQVERRFLVDSSSLDVQGLLSLSKSLGATNIPRLLNLTNAGTIYIPGEAKIGGDRPQPLSNIVNRGTLYGGGLQIATRNFVSEGTNITYAYPTNLVMTNGSLTNIMFTNMAIVAAYSGSIRIDADRSRIANGYLGATADVKLKSGDLFARNSWIRAGSAYVSYITGYETYSPGSISLTVTNELSDGGPGASNEWQCVGSIELLARPKKGDLLGTRIESIAPKFTVVKHTWAAEDRGALPAGYANNAAIGWLVLDGRASSLFTFSGAGTNNAIYVDYLEFRNSATNFATALQIDSNMKIYFADANLPPEKLNGKLGGRLRWVSAYTGSNSSTNWVSPSGRVYTFNKALLLSEDIDSDGDGIVNKMDATPFYVDESTGLAVRLEAGPPKTAVVSWIALAKSMNYLEFKTNLLASNWQVLTNFVHGPTTGLATVREPVPAAGQRYYRVRVQPPQP